MKISPALALIAALAAPSFAATKVTAPKKITAAQAAKAPKALSEHRRAELAVAEVSRDLKPWVGKSTKVSVRPAIVPFNGDRRNPITGEGPITVYVDQDTPTSGMWARMRSFFNPNRKQTYLVNVDNHGRAQILDRVSLAPQQRFARFFTSTLAIGSLFRDFVHSGRLTETIFTAAGAGGAALVNPWLSGALWMRVASVVNTSIKNQNDVRKTALAQTIAWAKDEGKAGSFPTLMESYREYQANIGESDSGAQPITLSRFAEQLSINRL